MQRRIVLHSLWLIPLIDRIHLDLQLQEGNSSSSAENRTITIDLSIYVMEKDCKCQNNIMAAAAPLLPESDL